MPDFMSIANKKVEDVEQPPLPPVGTYRWQITKLPEVKESANGDWEILTISCRVVEALDDVEADDYPGDLSKIVMQHRFMFNKNDEAEFERTEWSMRNFFEKHVQCVEPGMTIGEMLNRSVNGQFLGTIKWAQDKRDETGETMQAQIGRTAPVE